MEPHLRRQNTDVPFDYAIVTVRKELFDLGAYLASPPLQNKSIPLTIGENEILRLEKWIDDYSEMLPELKSFVLPGGSELNSSLTSNYCCRWSVPC